MKINDLMIENKDKYSNIVDTGNASIDNMADNYLTRAENLQNKVISFTGDASRVYANSALNSVRADQTSVYNQAVQDAYTGMATSNTYKFANDTYVKNISDMYLEDVSSGISNITNSVFKGFKYVNNLEKFKRDVVTKEATYKLKKLEAQAKLKLGWEKYNLSQDELDFAKENNSLLEEIARIPLED